MSLTLRFAAGSHTGNVRDHNEDSGYAGPRLLAVADGMGGQAAGEVASSEVISTLVQLDDDIPGSDILTSLDQYVQRANEKLRLMVSEDPRLDGMGTTLTALLWTGQRLGLVHVGDSRAYLLRGGELVQITQDHTWVQRLVDEGRITEEEATTHPQRSLLMRALGSADHIETDRSIREVRPGDRYLLCSDGLSGVVSQDTLRETLGAFASPEETVAQLIELALRGGGPDNITCIVADVLDVDSQESGALALQSDNPQIVGAVAENQIQRSGSPAQATPASRAAELGRPPGDPAASGPTTGVFRTFDEDDYLPPEVPRRRRALRRTLLIALSLAVLGGGLYAGYRWTQTQYFVAANGDHVALYRGISQDLGPVGLSSLEADHPDILLNLLPEHQRNEVRDSIAAGSLGEAERRVAELAEQAEACRLREAQEAEDARGGQPEQPEQGEPNQPNQPNAPEGEDDKGGENPGAGDEAAEAPTMTERQRELAARCPQG
ncbi:protein phosphatase 2C domain-containing protein [Streptomyces sp. DSM 44917]|uniref:Protein phosphatase 2C domain-containing protein n=1 Tax=Streptomyces boetiae TaxID=3075541 RepID=A0ABU2L606_9ACTN|nr:protein phosphatase 2C domain-containing protein [Streptomyces sp. DSM 44917]MDT0306996.1 protein phosphatase 2C domain-containing protein [Streptomyces sp. DSM 44917]